MVKFDRWFSTVVAFVLLAWLFRSEIVRLRAVEVSVGESETQPGNIVSPKFGEKAA